MNDNYQLTEFTFGSQHIQLFCLHSASTVIELGSGVGITGTLCRNFCNKVVSTDYNEEVLKIINKIWSFIYVLKMLVLLLMV